MKKKLTALLTAAVCALSSIGILPASAYSPIGYSMHFVILAAPPAGYPNASYVIHAGTAGFLSMHYLSAEQMNKLFGSSENYPATGDIVGVKCAPDWSASVLEEVSRIEISGVEKVDIIGSVYDEPTEEFFYLSERHLVDADGNRCYYPTPFFNEGYQPPEGFYDLSKVKTDDQLIMAVDNYGRPIACVDIIPLGDVNADSTLNILDVILLNKAVLIGEPLPALENAARSGETDYGQCDFNGNGTLDLDDSLGMMKRILNIEETE